MGKAVKKRLSAKNRLQNINRRLSQEVNNPPKSHTAWDRVSQAGYKTAWPQMCRHTVRARLGQRYLEQGMAIYTPQHIQFMRILHCSLIKYDLSDIHIISLLNITSWLRLRKEHAGELTLHKSG